MDEKEKDLNRAVKHDVSGTAVQPEAEEFADEMHAEPKNIDGEAGIATPQEEAAAEAASDSADPVEALSPEGVPDNAAPNLEERQAEDIAGKDGSGVALGKR